MQQTTHTLLAQWQRVVLGTMVAVLLALLPISVLAGPIPIMIDDLVIVIPDNNVRGSNFQHDSDGDGVNDTNVSISPCGNNLCAVAASDKFGVQQVTLPAGALTPSAGNAVMTGPMVAFVGNHLGGPREELMVYFEISRSATDDSPAMAVIDLDANTVVGTVSAPPHITHWVDGNSGVRYEEVTGYIALPRGPDGKRYPFLAPGFGDSSGLTWGYACLFRPGSVKPGRCGNANFFEMDTVPKNPATGGPAREVTYGLREHGYWFREVGGYLQDIDGDGWEDINLIYHGLLRTMSPRTGLLIDQVVVNVRPDWSHMGRLYGTHKAFAGQDGMLRNLIVGGVPVGLFTDHNCNVIRFLAVVESTPGIPNSRELAWGSFFSHRWIEGMAGCIHRFSDSYTVVDGAEAVVVNYFTPTGAHGGGPNCGGDCLTAMGTWGMTARRISDGQGITGSTQTYVWGRSDDLLPSGEIVYLVESLPTVVPFNLSFKSFGEGSKQMNVWSLVNGLWTSRGRFPAVGRPRLTYRNAEGNRGVGSYTSFAELTLSDVDGDGLSDVQLEDGRWVGYSAAAGAFVAKN